MIRISVVILSVKVEGEYDNYMPTGSSKRIYIEFTIRSESSQI